jgi:hypothetical protein
MAPSPYVKSSADFIAAARKKVLRPDKLKEALEKIRKGATASFTLSKVIGILDTLGWKVESKPGWVPFHFKSHDDNRWVLKSVFVYKSSEIPHLESEREKTIQKVVSRLPEKVTVGEKVVMDVSPIKKGAQYGDDVIHYFEFKEWTGADGIKLTSPRGKVIELLPDRSYVNQPLERALHGYESELNAGGWKEDASAALGKEVHVPAAARTRENTGTCPVCVGNYKLSNGRLVLHGYMRPGWGHVRGECKGVDWPPLETSASGAKMWLEKLESDLKREKENLVKIETNQVSELRDRDGVWHKPGSNIFRSLYERFERDTKSNIKLYEADVATYNKVISLWKPRPMPKEGEPQRGLGFFTKS